MALFSRNTYDIADDDSRLEARKNRASGTSRASVGNSIERATASNQFAVIVFAVLIVALIGVGIHAAIFPKEGGQGSVAGSTYNWDYLSQEDGRFYYNVGGKSESRTGVDVSEHQGYINWQAVQRDGVSFAFIRVGNRGVSTGGLSQDNYFEYNVAAASQVGLDVGAYFYSQALTEDEAREEADFVIERLRGRHITYPVAYDHERLSGTPGRADDLSPEQMTKNAAAFCERIASAGYEPIIYGSMKDLLRYNLPDLANYKIWLAQYNVNSPTLNQHFTFWQYTNTGTVAGIDGNVDLNIQFLSED